MKCFTKTFSYKMVSQNPSSPNVFIKSYFVGLLESASLRAGMPVEVRLPTSGSLPNPAKVGPILRGGVVV